MSVCTTAMPFLSSIWTWLGLAGVGVAGKVAYSYSSLSFWPSFLAASSLVRIFGGLASIVNLLWRANVFVYLALFTTFSGTLGVALGGNKVSLRELGLSVLTDLYEKVGFAVKHFADSIGFLSEWVKVLAQEGFCSGLGSMELLVSAGVAFWTGLAAYILAIRLYDWMYGKGMTRDVEWPEYMMVVVAVTLASLLVVGTSEVVQALQSGEALFNLLGNESVNVSQGLVNNSTG